jgi:hypothetical protein
VVERPSQRRTPRGWVRNIERQYDALVERHSWMRELPPAEVGSPDVSNAMRAEIKRWRREHDDAE